MPDIVLHAPRSHVAREYSRHPHTGCTKRPYCGSEILSTFKPRLDILDESQRRLWPSSPAERSLNVLQHICSISGASRSSHAVNDPMGLEDA
jgi:hypothetical protein